MLPILFFSLLIGINGNLYGCPNNVTCIEKETCCQTKNGLWSCCPIENGICCEDGLHCCSKNEKCLSNGKCSSSNNEISFSFPLRTNENQLKTVQCPDGSSCQDGETCCQLASGHYACCPQPDAVCCDDHIHCCPKDHTCDVQHGHCKKKLDQSNSVPCPDGSTACPDRNTCCLLPDGGYGCCPLENAVCCSDHLHCCPHGDVCDTTHQQCVSQISIPWFKKKPSFNIKQKLIEIIDHTTKNVSQLKISSKIKSFSTIQCPDGNYCPEETTCCETEQSTYGCCPYPQGSCCSDKIHCCGNGYSCDDSGNRCTRRFEETNKIEIISSKIQIKTIKKENEMKNLIFNKIKEDQLCPDEKTKCPSSSTCCPNKDKNKNEITYSCCPYSKGVCCGSNGSVCCPNNYDCNEDQLSCQLRDSIFLRQILLTTDYYQCSSSNVVCTTDQTCCNTLGTSDQPYACCPYPDGQCCSDGAHCCPSGTTCDMVFGGCF